MNGLYNVLIELFFLFYAMPRLDHDKFNHVKMID